MINILGKFSDTAYTMLRSKMDPTGLLESSRTNQIISKRWLVDEVATFDPSLRKVLVLGSWNGIILYELMKKYCDVDWFDFIDIDKKSHRDRDFYFEVNDMEKNYNSIIADATEWSDFKDYDLVINCSCEHMRDIPAVYGPLYALQSNDYRTVSEHINCVDSAEELTLKNNLTETFVEGKLDMGHYNRFMSIGFFA
tara:strand:- start:1039 stop:1626 length:588 start_codon:yes stop_codon:yes gene_type:complete